jgi:hypothetical protein
LPAGFLAAAGGGVQVLMLPFYSVPFVFFREVAAQVTARLAQHKEEEHIKEDEDEDDGKLQGSSDP